MAQKDERKGDARIQELERENAHLKQVLRENLESARLLVRKDRELTATNDKLAERTKELNEIGKILVNRDRELSESNERLRELDEVKTQFVSVAAHQLRTPLTGIKWSLHALLSGRVDDLSNEQEKFVRDAFNATERVIKLVNDLLNVSRLEEGRFGFTFSLQSIVPIIKQVCERHQDTAEQKHISFSLNVDEAGIPEVYADEERIDIVFDNMVNNALKYTKPNGEVAVSVFTKDGNVVVSVSDTGIGIPEKQKTHIFKRFFRARNAQLYHTNGTGLGLYLSKNIVEQHDGDMYLESEEMKGTTVYATIPIPREEENEK